MHDKELEAVNLKTKDSVNRNPGRHLKEPLEEVTTSSQGRGRVIIPDLKLSTGPQKGIRNNHESACTAV